jgi:hypothetical protein
MIVMYKAFEFNDLGTSGALIVGKIVKDSKHGLRNWN